MLNITEKQRSVLTPLIPEFEVLVEKDELSNLLEEIDDLILDEFSDDFEKLSKKGTELQIIYDQIFCANKH